jgi:hypothetical protein
MKRIKAKLKSSKGESLAELLAAILIGTLSIALLVSGIAVAVNINSKAQESDSQFYEALAVAEEKNLSDAQKDKTITVTESSSNKTATIEVYAFGTDGLLSSYRSKAALESQANVEEGESP